MYQFNLTESLIAPQQDTDIRDTTTGGLLRDVAAAGADRRLLQSQRWKAARRTR